VTETASTVPSVERASDSALDGPIPTQPLLSKRGKVAATIVSVVVVLVVVAACVGLGYLGYTSYDRAGDAVPGTVRLRDMSFIVMAAGGILGIILMLIIAILLAVIVIVVYDRIVPILEGINRAIGEAADTVQNVRGTTRFIGEKMVNPVIELSSYASGVRRIFKGITDLWTGRK
jgi:hypothetical protein